MKFIVWFITTSVLIIWVAEARSEESPWTGWHAAIGQGMQMGEHKLSYHHRWVGDLTLWEMPVSADYQKISFGYRRNLGNSPLTLGVVGSLSQGPLVGSLSWAYDPIGAEAELTYLSEFTASAGFEFGLILSDQWILTAEAGGVMATARLTLDASVFHYDESWSESGYFPGYFYSLGLTRQFDSGLTIGIEIGQQTFSVSADEWGGTGTLQTDASYVGFSIGYQF